MSDHDNERRVQRMTPPANTSKEAVALRRAALAFAGVPDTGDFHDAAGMRANRDLLRAGRAYDAAAKRAERTRKTADIELKFLRIRDATDDPQCGWIERYYLRDRVGRYRERTDIPGNGQYAPGPQMIIAWFRQMGVTHVEVTEGWHCEVKPDTYPLAKFARILYRLSKENE